MLWFFLSFIYVCIGVAFYGDSHGRRCARGGWRHGDRGTFCHVITETGFGMTMLFWPLVLTCALFSHYATKSV